MLLPRVNGLQLVSIEPIRVVEGVDPYEVVVEFRVCVESTRRGFIPRLLQWEKLSSKTTDEVFLNPN